MKSYSKERGEDVMEEVEQEVLFQETWKTKQFQQFESRMQAYIFYMVTCDEILEKWLMEKHQTRKYSCKEFYRKQYIW